MSKSLLQVIAAKLIAEEASVSIQVLGSGKSMPSDRLSIVVLGFMLEWLFCIILARQF